MTPASDGASPGSGMHARRGTTGTTTPSAPTAMRSARRRDLDARLLATGPGDLLDTGMGAGPPLRGARVDAWTVFGVDASAEMVALARERLPDAHDRLTQGSVEQLPFADGSFDAVTATGVLEFTDVPRALGELARVLRPGGRAVVSYPNPRALYGLWKTRVWYPLLWVGSRLLGRPRAQAPKGRFHLSPRPFAAAAEGAGLRVDSVHYTGFLVLPSPLDEFLPPVAAWLAERLEGAPPALGRALATQIVYVARKPAEARNEP